MALNKAKARQSAQLVFFLSQNVSEWRLVSFRGYVFGERRIVMHNHRKTETTMGSG